MLHEEGVREVVNQQCLAMVEEQESRGGELYLIAEITSEPSANDCCFFYGFPSEVLDHQTSSRAENSLGGKTQTSAILSQNNSDKPDFKCVRV